MMRRRRCACGCDTCTGPNAPCWTGEVDPSVSADLTSTTIDGTTQWAVPRPRSPVPITPNGRPATTDDDPAPGDTWQDLVLVLAIAGGFGLILALETLTFCVVFGWRR